MLNSCDDKKKDLEKISAITPVYGTLDDLKAMITTQPPRSLNSVGKIYFESSIGIGWNNVNVKATNIESTDNFQLHQSDYNLLYLNYREGKGQRFYMPVNVSFGYNFGTR